MTAFDVAVKDAYRQAEANKILSRALRAIAKMHKTLPEDLPWDDVMESIRLTANRALRESKKKVKGRE